MEPEKQTRAREWRAEKQRERRRRKSRLIEEKGKGTHWCKYCREREGETRVNGERETKEGE